MKNDRHTIIFASFAESIEKLDNILVMAESIRSFAGQYKNAPIWLYAPKELLETATDRLQKLSSLGVEIKISRTPEGALRFPYARKVFAAGKAESEANGKTAILVWMDDDTVILQEPGVFALPDGVSLGYRPVMHKLIGSLYSEPPDEFWSRIYEVLSVPQSAMFPMETHTDHQTIRPYFNAGILVVRPECGILRKWAHNFEALYRNSSIFAMCREDRYRMIFLHQTALACAALNLLNEDKMHRLPDQVNYPLFFKEMFGAEHEYDNLSGVISLRYDIYFQNPAPDWAERLKGPKHLISWLKNHLGEKGVGR